MAEIMLRAVVASFKLNHCKFDFNFCPASENSKVILNTEINKNSKPIATG